MENINDHCNKEENELNKSKNSSDGNGCAVREASNVILLVSNSSETGKYIQTLWYLKHINSTVAIETSNEDENEVEIVKISARDGDEVHNDEKLLVTSNTLISYVARSYRFVFVIDISPSTFIVDGAASCVPHSKIINRLQQCLEGLLVDGNFLPANKFSPEIFITICFYSPFIAFDEDRVIVQGYLLTKKNIDCILQYVQERFALFSNRLCWTVQPHLRKWNHERKKLRQRAGDLLPENFFRQQSHATDGFRDSMHGLLAAQMTSRTSRTDEGFINSEWSLMFMLRVGLIGLQLLPDTAQPRDCNTNAVFGHFSSPGFLTFLARGTSGIYIPDEYQATADNGLDPVQSQSLLCKNLQLLDTSDNYIKDLIQQINPEFVEPYTCGVIRRMHYSMEYESYLEYFIRLRLHEGFILRELRVLKKGDDQSSILVELSLPWKPQVTIGYKICALSEDYTKRAKLKITVICEAQCGIIRDLLSDRCSINTTKQTFSDAYRHTIFRLLETDRMLIHVHSFNSLPDIFRLPPEVLKEKSLFRYVIKENKAVLTISTRELETLCSQNVTTANFVEFWRIISEFEERLWQSWSQVYTFRVILTHDHPLPPRLFLFEEPNVKVTSQLSLAVFYDMLAQMTTFSLVHGQTYVNDNDNHIPKSFYIVKLNLETQLVVIKLAFLDGLTVAFREQVIREFQRNFTSLSIERSCFFTKMLEFADVGDDCATVAETMQLPALTIINRPLEVMLARYKKIPLILNRIIRLEKTDETNRDLILHNSLAKRRLNEGFHIVYGDNGIINLVKHVDDMEQQLHCGSAVLQYIIFPPTTIRPMRIMKEHLEKIPPLSKIVRIRGVETKKSVPSGNSTLKSDLDLQLMTEMWLEPLAVVDPQYVTWSGIIQQQNLSLSLNNLRKDEAQYEWKEHF
uniref:Bm4336 n=1 Tax=Brugia malayi TaxID=6279 RepID=A0A0H5S540_BRUMA|nr:Bm4336 [Brugia malayi]